MQIIGCQVNHVKFGQGVVRDLTGKTLTVDFPSGEKHFLYPDAFSRYLVLADAGMQEDIVAEYRAGRKKEETSRHILWEKQDEAIRLRSIVASPQSQIIANLKREEIVPAAEDRAVSAGVYLSGFSKGLPKTPDRVKPTSACLFTYLPKGQPEPARKIAGVAMVRDDFYGENCRDGQVPLHPRYCLLLDEPGLNYWDLAEHGEKIPRWGNTALKYYNTGALKLILEAIVESVAGKEQEVPATELYSYYCDINHLMPKSIGKKS